MWPRPLALVWPRPKSHVRHDDPEIVSISHIHVLLLFSAISFVVSLPLPSWSPSWCLSSLFFIIEMRLNVIYGKVKRACAAYTAKGQRFPRDSWGNQIPWGSACCSAHPPTPPVACSNLSDSGNEEKYSRGEKWTGRDWAAIPRAPSPVSPTSPGYFSPFHHLKSLEQATSPVVALHWLPERQVPQEMASSGQLAAARTSTAARWWV